MATAGDSMPGPTCGRSTGPNAGNSGDVISPSSVTSSSSSNRSTTSPRTATDTAVDLVTSVTDPTCEVVPATGKSSVMAAIASRMRKHNPTRCIRPSDETDAGRLMGRANLSVRHHSRHDRSNYPFPGDTAISSGACQLRFWIYRESANAGFVAYLQDDIDAQHANRDWTVSAAG